MLWNVRNTGVTRKRPFSRLLIERLESRQMLAGLVMEESVFDANLFATNIEEQVPVDTTGPNGVVGYTYAIIDSNPSQPIAGGGGNAIMPWDNGGNAIMADPGRPQEIASTSKLITGAAIMHLLQEKHPSLGYVGLNAALQMELNRPIVNYLPTNWGPGNPDPSVNNWTSLFNTITVGELLTHTSGLRNDNNPTGGGPGIWVTTSTLTGGGFSGGGNIYNYSGLQQISESGSVDPSKPSDYWTNNFAWFRVMLPYMWDEVDNTALDANAISGLLPTDPTQTPFSPMISKDPALANDLINAMIDDWGPGVAPDAKGIMSITPDRVVASIYKYYVSTNLLQPSGVVNPQTKTTGPNPTLLYPLDPTIIPGTDVWPSVAGGPPTPAQVTGFDTGDQTPNVGSRGWSLSANDLARTFWAVRNGVNGAPLLEDATLDLMDAQGLGWQHSTNGGLVGDFGQYWGHNGINFRPAAPTALTIPSPSVPNNARLGSMNNTVAIAFDNGVAASLLINSQIQSEDRAVNTPVVIGAAFNPTAIPTGTGTIASVIAAYDNAWTDLVYEGDPVDEVFTVQTNTLNPGFIDIMTPTGTITRRTDTLRSLTIRGLGGNDTFNVIDLPDGIQLVLDGGAGEDEFHITSVDDGENVTLNGDGGMDTLFAAEGTSNLETVNQITFNGGADADTVELDDLLNNNPFDHAHTYFIGAGSVYRQAGAPGTIYNVQLDFNDVEHAVLDTSLAAFNDFVEVLSTGPLTAEINTNIGNDAVEVAGLTENIDDVNGLSLNLGPGTDSVTIYDQNSPWKGPQYQTYTVSDTQVSRFADSPAIPGIPLPVTVQMSGIESLDLFTSNADDFVNIVNMPMLAGTINLGEGDDTAQTTSGNLEDVDDLVIIGAKGEDVVLLDDAMNPYGVPADGSYPPGIPTANIYDVSTSRVRRDGTGIPPDPFIPSDINVDYQDVEHLSLTTAEMSDVVNISGGGAWTTDLILGEGNDEVNASPIEQNIEFVDGLTVYGEDGQDELILYDAHNPYSHVQSNQYEVSAGHVSRFRDVHGPGETHMPPGTDPADAVDVLVQMVSVELLDLTTGDSGDNVEVISSTTDGTSINTFIGDDVITSVSGNLSDVDGLFIDSNAGEDTLILDDTMNPYGAPDASNYDLTLGQVVRGTVAPSGVAYSGLEHLDLLSGDQDDHIEIARGGDLTTDVVAGDGEDEILVSPNAENLQLVPGLTVDGGANHDQVFLHDANNPYINNIGHLYTIDEQQVSRDGGVFGQPLAVVSVDVAYLNVEAIELETGTESEIVNIGGAGSEASLTIRSNEAADRINVLDSVFAELFLYGGNPTHIPGDVLHLEAPAGSVTGLFPTGASSGYARIDNMRIHYWEIENVDSAFPILYATVAARHIFYNNSSFDDPIGGVGDPAANVNDDLAIASLPMLPPNKSPLLPNVPAAFQHYTSYTRGINGVMIDIFDLPGTPTADDFIFRVGNTNDTASWSEVAISPSISVRTGDGTGGSDRVTLIWPDNQIENQWLQVTVLPTLNTGLSIPDVHYWGNQIAETGNLAGNTAVDIGDVLGVLTNLTSAGSPVGIDNNFDFDRDGAVNISDVLVVLNNLTPAGSTLALFTPSQELNAIAAFIESGDVSPARGLPLDWAHGTRFRPPQIARSLDVLRLPPPPLPAQILMERKLAWQGSRDNPNASQVLSTDDVFANVAEDDQFIEAK